MCGRFALNENPRKLAEHFELSGNPWFGGNVEFLHLPFQTLTIAPSQSAPSP